MEMVGCGPGPRFLSIPWAWSPPAGKLDSRKPGGVTVRPLHTISRKPVAVARPVSHGAASFAFYRHGNSSSSSNPNPVSRAYSNNYDNIYRHSTRNFPGLRGKYKNSTVFHQMFDTLVRVGNGAETGVSYFRSGSRASNSVEILVNPDSINSGILSKIGLLKDPYKRPFYLSNCHAETIFAAFYRALPILTYKRELLTMPDGGTVALDWPVAGAEDEELWRGELDPDAPVLVLLPGLTGGSGDTYVRHMLVRARKAGWRVVVFNSRACGDSPVTTPQFYSASFTGDLRQVVKRVGSLYPNSRLYAAGWSLGANILVRYAGEEGEDCPLAGAISLCNPFDLVVADKNFHKGFNNIYDKSLARALGKIFAKHAPLFDNLGGDFNVPLAAKAKTIRDFDDGITRVSFGFKSVDDYYAQSSSSLSIKDVRIPLLCIQAADDPIAPAEGIPRAAIEANLNCALVVTPSGGHLGWVAGSEAPFGAPWTDPLIVDYLMLLNSSLHTRPAPESVRGQPEDPQVVGVETRETTDERTSLAEPIIR